MKSHPINLALKFFFHIPSIKKKIIPFIYKSFRKYYIFAPFHIIISFLYIIHIRAIDIFDEINFDKKHKVQTSFIVYQNSLNFNDINIQKNAARYRPVSPRRVKRAINFLKKYYLNKTVNISFIDYGCGAGRVLIMAAELCFHNIIGVELSSDLVEICKKNINSYMKKFNQHEHKPQFHILLQDATTYTPPKGSKLFFFFDPFSHEIYRIVINKIKHSAKNNAYDIFIIDVGSTFNYEEKGFILIKKMFETRLYRYAS